MINRSTSNCFAFFGNKALKSLLDDWLSDHGWWSLSCADPADIETVAGDAPPALIIIDEISTRPVWRDWVARLRTVDGPLAGTPILLVTADENMVGHGISAILPVPLAREATLAILENWAGALNDHDFRTLDNPHYRLVRLGGRDVANGLIARFADQLEQARAWLDTPELEPRLPHQIAGLAGMLGYADISESWRAIDGGDSFDSAAVRAQIDAVIARIQGRFSLP